MERSASKTRANVDPVCGMEVVPGPTRLVAIYKGHSYWFCSMACREAFETNPARYFPLDRLKGGSWFGRYFGRLARPKKDRFEGGPPRGR